MIDKERRAEMFLTILIVLIFCAGIPLIYNADTWTKRIALIGVVFGTLYMLRTTLTIVGELYKENERQETKIIQIQKELDQLRKETE